MILFAFPCYDLVEMGIITASTEGYIDSLVNTTTRFRNSSVYYIYLFVQNYSSYQTDRSASS